VDIGLQFSQPAVKPSPAESIRSYLALIKLAHRSGFRSFWKGQHFMSDKYLLFQPLTLLARAAASAPGMKMGTSVLLLPMLNPLEVAEHGATLDAITDGGFILGAGLGYRNEEFAGSGVKREDVIERFEEAILLIKALWGEPPANFAGKHFRVREARINPRPVQKPRPPLLLGAYAERAVERAGRLGDGWIIPPELFGSILEERLLLFRESARSHGSGETIAMMRAFHTTPDPYEAEAVENLVGTHFQRKRDWGILRGDRVSQSTPRENAREAAVIGDPEDCADRIENIRERYRPDMLILLMGFQGIEAASLERSIRLAGERILPSFHS